MTLLVNGDDTTNTIFGYSDDKETSVTSFGDDTLITYNVIDNTHNRCPVLVMTYKT
jgi:hypothetical protein